jgi:hypothetical protein
LFGFWSMIILLLILTIEFIWLSCYLFILFIASINWKNIYFLNWQFQLKNIKTLFQTIFSIDFTQFVYN